MRKQARISTLALIGVVFVVSGCKKNEGTKKENKPVKAAVKEPKKKTVEKATKVAKKNSILRLKGKTIASNVKNRPEGKKWDKTKAKYKNLAQVKRAGKKAIGKTILFKGFVKSVMSPALLGECKKKGDTIPLVVTYPKELQDTLRGLGRFCQCKNPVNILVKITNDKKVRDSFPFYASEAVVGEIVAIYDIQPSPAPKNLPKGVDFVSFNDILFAGGDAIGKVVDLGVKRSGDPVVVKGINLYELQANECGANVSNNPEIRVLETKETKAFFAKLPSNGKICQRVRLKITKGPTRNHSNAYQAVIVGIGEQFPKIPFYDDKATCP